LLAILLLDENMSPRIVRSLWERDIDAVHVRDRGLLGAADHEIWKFARQEVRTVVTINGRDFRRLARNSEDHPGVIVVPSGGSPEAQFKFIMAAVMWVTSANAPEGFSNRYLEIGERGDIILAEVTSRE
jgi:predicted nuclease of predicted toxin-antitoxin system